MAITRSLTTAISDGASSGMFKNRIINGDMRIDQRNAGAAVTVTDAYTLDRWEVREDTDGAASCQQVADAPDGFNNSVKITTTTADSSLTTIQRLIFRQNIEGYNISDLAFGTSSASAITISFWVKSSLIGTFGASVSNTNTRFYPFTYSISAANTWEKKTVTIPGDTSGTWLVTNGVGLRLLFGLGVGPDYSGAPAAWTSSPFQSVTGAVSVIGTLNATWQVTGVQLEAGTTATNFERRAYGHELALCQRYYQPLNTAGMFILMNYIDGLSIYQTTVWYKVSMRSGPTISTSTFTYRVGGSNTNGTVNNVTQASTGINFADIRLNCPSATNTVGVGGHVTLDAGWAASAEL